MLDDTQMYNVSRPIRVRPHVRWEYLACFIFTYFLARSSAWREETESRGPFWIVSGQPAGSSRIFPLESHRQWSLSISLSLSLSLLARHAQCVITSELAHRTPHAGRLRDDNNTEGRKKKQLRVERSRGAVWLASGHTRIPETIHETHSKTSFDLLTIFSRYWYKFLFCLLRRQVHGWFPSMRIKKNWRNEERDMDWCSGGLEAVCGGRLSDCTIELIDTN